MPGIVLYEPEIPPNTGSIIRLAANTGAPLALIPPLVATCSIEAGGTRCVQPLGFELDDARLKRAGLDYREFADVRVYPNLEAYLESVQPDRVFAFTTKATIPYTAPRYRAGDALLFGPETRGLPAPVLAGFPPERKLRIPMRPHSRSLNLGNAVAIAVYEAWRQMGFA